MSNALVVPTQQNVYLIEPVASCNRYNAAHGMRFYIFHFAYCKSIICFDCLIMDAVITKTQITQKCESTP